MARRSKVARMAALGLLGALTLSGCGTDRSFWTIGWPRGITDEAAKMHSLWVGSIIAAMVVGVLVWFLIGWSAFHYRKRKGGDDELPRQTAYNLPFEILYTLIPFIIIAVLFFFTVGTQNKVMARSDDPDLTVAVNAFKWNWQFVYPEHNGPDGLPANTVGTSSQIPVLVVPTDRTIRFEVASADVIHSFWVPEFLFKLDVIPGNENGRNNVFQVTVRQEGAYVGRCAELCGTYHAFMNFEVRAVTGNDYDAYIRARQQGMNTAQALESIGQPGQATTTRPFNISQEAQRGSG